MHTGANNIPRDGAEAVLEKLEDLCGKILQANPRYVYKRNDNFIFKIIKI